MRFFIKEYVLIPYLYILSKKMIVFAPIGINSKIKEWEMVSNGMESKKVVTIMLDKSIFYNNIHIIFFVQIVKLVGTYIFA